MENKYKISGWALSIYGAMSLITLLFGYSLLLNYFGPIGGIYFLFLAIYNLFIALGFLAFLCGVYLLKNNSAVHRIALPVAVVSIFSFPAGTIAGGLYLWQRHENS